MAFKSSISKKDIAIAKKEFMEDKNRPKACPYCGFLGGRKTLDLTRLDNNLETDPFLMEELVVCTDCWQGWLEIREFITVDVKLMHELDDVGYKKVAVARVNEVVDPEGREN